MSEEPTRAPAVSIVLPTYNRAHLLPQAVRSIRAQSFTDWEIIIVDDGSTDDTREVAERLSAGCPQPIRYVYQENQRPYRARKNGCEQARGELVAFFDSDDLWLPHHLQDCYAALQANPEVGWVYAAAKMIEPSTNRVMNENTFYQDGKPRPFLGYRTRKSGELNVIVEDNIGEKFLNSGFYVSVQASLVRREWARKAFKWDNVGMGEDILMVFFALKAGCVFGYIDKIHIHYMVHPGEHWSAAGGEASPDKALKASALYLKTCEDWLAGGDLTPGERRVMERGIARWSFWNVGYTLWQLGRTDEALAAYRRGLQLDSRNVFFWKTYLLARVKRWLGLAPRPASRGEEAVRTRQPAQSVG